MSGEEGSAFARLRRLARMPVPLPRMLPRRRQQPDVAGLVRGAGLPEPLGALVVEIVRRARLWRSERADVAEELLAHMRDGLDAGAEPASIAMGFGDARLSAKLIGRAMRRKRPLAWRAWRRGLQGLAACLGLLVAVYLYAALRFFGGAPAITRDYLAELNAPAVALAPQEKAWPLYREAILALREVVDPARSARPGEQGWTELVAALEAQAPALAMVREAAARPGLGYVAGFGIDEPDRALWPGLPGAAETAPGSLISVLLPHLAEVQKLVRVLAADMHRAAAAGDGALAAADFEAAIGMSQQVRDPATLIGQLVALALVSKAIETLGEVLALHPEAFTDAELRRLAHGVAALDRDRLRVRLDGERMFFADFLQRVYTDDGEGDGYVTAAGLEWLGTGVAGARPDAPAYLMAPAAAIVMAGRREMNSMYERLVARAEAEWSKPLWLQDSEALDREIEALEASSVNHVRYLPVLLLMPAYGRAGVQAELAAQRRDAVLVAIALELHRRRSGAWPESLDVLVPDLLPSVPPDRFDGKPLRYRLIDGKPLLYSIGSDRDDDAGMPASDESPGFKRGDGDWVLWQE